jgi:hypothetical protein
VPRLLDGASACLERWTWVDGSDNWRGAQKGTGEQRRDGHGPCGNAPRAAAPAVAVLAFVRVSWPALQVRSTSSARAGDRLKSFFFFARVATRGLPQAWITTCSRLICPEWSAWCLVFSLQMQRNFRELEKKKPNTLVITNAWSSMFYHHSFLRI